MTPEMEAFWRQVLSDLSAKRVDAPADDMRGLLDALDAERRRVRELEAVIEAEFGVSEFDAFSAALDNPPKAGPELKQLMRSGDEWTPDGLHRPTIEACLKAVGELGYGVCDYGAGKEEATRNALDNIRALAEPQEKP